MADTKVRRNTDAFEMVQQFAVSGARVARVTSRKTDNPYSVFLTTRHNLIKAGLLDAVEVYVKKGVCYIRKK